MTFTPPPQTPNFKAGVGRLATDRYDFEAHLEGTNPPGYNNFRHTATQVDLSPNLVISGNTVTNVQQALQLLAGLITPPNIPLATATLPGIIQLSGDLGGTATSPRVVGLQGKPLAPTGVITPGNVLTWNGATWTPAAANFTGPAGGDLSSSYPNPTVAKIQNRSVSSAAPSNGNTLVWNSVNGDWEPTFQAVGGDVLGAINATRVVKLQNNAIQNQSPFDGQVLTWLSSNQAWTPVPTKPTIINGSGSVLVTFTITTVTSVVITTVVPGTLVCFASFNFGQNPDTADDPMNFGIGFNTNSSYTSGSRIVSVTANGWSSGSLIFLQPVGVGTFTIYALSDNRTIQSMNCRADLSVVFAA